MSVKDTNTNKTGSSAARCDLYHYNSPCPSRHQITRHGVVDARQQLQRPPHRLVEATNDAAADAAASAASNTHATHARYPAAATSYCPTRQRLQAHAASGLPPTGLLVPARAPRSLLEATNDVAPTQLLLLLATLPCQGCKRMPCHFRAAPDQHWHHMAD